ncbi:MAG TPA: pantoate--beta-alanine ligase [Candidatus Acidoferrales bacterium]|jgi:pantoate--beta-alanine ligase|nr:pantoate--beta-alanine ligase [Candidatus Acidoferrales bacterium]
METIHTIEWMKQIARENRVHERVLGLVPTMGALHEGHFSLIGAAQRECAPVVVSLFVNPKQFGPAEDLNKYPRTLEADRAALEALGVDYLFAPSAQEMYPPGFRSAVVVEGLSDRLEGRSRPGHFRGVTTVVLKLFEIVQPRFAYFGRKDAQQARLIRQMSADLNLDTDVVVCPIVREADGLALSSRNVYLSGEDRRAAATLSRSLAAVRDEIAKGERDTGRLLDALRRALATEPRVALDYAEIVDNESLEPVASLRGTCYVLLAAKVSETRLIDNALIEPDGDSFCVTL